jgi:spermidine/putrescine transport system substrate-binding protein
MPRPASSDGSSDEPASRRGLLRALGAAGAVATTGGLAGCAAVRGDGTTVPADLDSWPPDGGAADLALGHPWTDWAEWAAGAFEPPAAPVDVTVERCNANGLDLDRSRLERLTEGRHGVSLLGAQDWWVEDRGPGRAHPLPVDSLPAAGGLSPLATDAAAFAGPDRPRGLPLTVEPYPLVYDTTAFDEPPASLSVLFEDALAGRVAVEGHLLGVRAQVAAMAAGQHPHDPDDFDAVAGTYADLRGRLRDDEAAVADPGRSYDRRQVRLLADGDVVAGVFPWHVAFAARFDEGAPVDVVVPREGALYRTRWLAVPHGAPNPMAALALANWLLRPENAAELVTRAGRRPAVDVSEHVPERYREFLSLPADRPYVHNDLLPEDVSVAYGELRRRVEGDG